VGWAAPAPDFEVTYTGSPGFLRFYFLAASPSDNTALIINDPLGAWWCIDDTWGTYHPTIDFSHAISGPYEIWVASYQAGMHFPGTLYVTHDANHHPLLG
jgi:hypothetical protein